MISHSRGAARYSKAPQCVTSSYAGNQGNCFRNFASDGKACIKPFGATGSSTTQFIVVM